MHDFRRARPGGSPGAILSTASMPGDHPAEHRVIAVEARIGREHDEELAVGAVRTVSARAAPTVPRRNGMRELGLQVGQVGAALAGSLGIAALGHEAGDHAVEGQPVVEAAAHQRLDPLDMMRREVRPQLDHDRAAVRQLERSAGSRDWRRPPARRDDARQRGRRQPAPARPQSGKRHERQREQSFSQHDPPRIDRRR